ncbi:MAG: T9SS type A sorting domain-containing protein [Bacteroidota bacterium]
MKHTLIIFLTFIPFTIMGQGFTEICPSATTNGTLVTFEEFEDDYYATGFFNQICGNSANYIAKWNGSEWENAGFGLTDPGHSLTPSNDTLFIARYEESIDSNWVYYYHDQTLSKLGEGVYLTTASGFSNLPNIYDIAIFQNKIIACGEFDRAGTQTISGIMQWNGNQWTGLDSGLGGNIPATAPVMFPHELMVHDDKLYIVGNFRMAGGLEVNGIAYWDGNNWHAMGDGFNNTVYGIGVYNDEIYAGGSFTASGQTPLNRIAKWTGSEWVSPGFGFTSLSGNEFTFVHTLKVIDDQLYVAGGLKEITYDDQSTEPCGGIVSFNGIELDNFDGGVAGNDIEAVIKTDDGQLLVGGGVFGNGYAGVQEISTSITSTNPNAIEVIIFPNPVDDRLYLDTKSFTPESITIHNTMGRMVASEIKYSGQSSLDINHLPEGIYIVSFYSNDEVVSKRFSVVR